MKSFLRLLSFLRPYRRGVIVSFVLAGSAMAMTVAIPWLVGRAVNEINAGDKSALLPVVIALAVAGLARLALSVGRRLVSGRISLGVEYDLRSKIYGHLQSLDLEFFDHQQTGQLMSRATVDLQAIRFFLGYGLIFIVQNTLTILLAGAVMFATNPALAALALAPVPFVILMAQRYGKRSRPALQEVQQRIAELTANVEENISGVRVIKAFAREPLQLARFREGVTRVFDQQMYSTRLRALYSPLLGFLPNIGLAVVLLYGGRLVIQDQLTLGAFVAFYTYMLMLLSPMRSLGMALGLSQRAVASGNRLFEIIDRKPLIVSKPGARPLPQGAGHVEFRDVTFSYVGDEPALEGVSIDVRPGRAIALVGPTAAGKSTLLALVCRLYDVNSGAVLVDGADVRDVEVESLRHEIALVSDDNFLFSASVGDNIAYATPSASDEQIEMAARRAQIHDFIAQLPNGYDTLVGERGLTLSGGQRQRIAIARALIADPRILILDDATASIDAKTDSEIRAGLAEVMRDRTTFIVAHRPSSIALADEVVVLDHGRVEAQGTHEELLESSEIYSEIVEAARPDSDLLLSEEETREAVGL